MLIIPAIDIIDGRVVRLHQGNFNKEKFYSDRPVAIALAWQKKGAGFLHLVDLDGAREGGLRNADMIADIMKAVRVPCEVGGGLRDIEDAEYYIKKGARRVVFGTKAFEDRAFLERLTGKLGDKIVVSVDFAGNRVVKKGWQEETDINPADVIGEMQRAGVKTLVMTDITLDGTLMGPAIDRIKEILRTIKVSLIVSGGISCLEDIKRLKEIETKNLEGVIIGRALYEGKIDLEEAIRIAC